jgi:hypothetical protein
MEYDLGIQDRHLRDVDFDPTDTTPFTTVAACIHFLKGNRYQPFGKDGMFKRDSDQTTAMIWERSELDPVDRDIIAAAWAGERVLGEADLCTSCQRDIATDGPQCRGCFLKYAQENDARGMRS